MTAAGGRAGLCRRPQRWRPPYTGRSTVRPTCPSSHPQPLLTLACLRRARTRVVLRRGVPEAVRAGTPGLHHLSGELAQLEVKLRSPTSASDGMGFSSPLSSQPPLSAAASTTNSPMASHHLAHRAGAGARSNSGHEAWDECYQRAGSIHQVSSRHSACTSTCAFEVRSRRDGEPGRCSSRLPLVSSLRQLTHFVFVPRAVADACREAAGRVAHSTVDAATAARARGGSKRCAPFTPCAVSCLEHPNQPFPYSDQGTHVRFVRRAEWASDESRGLPTTESRSREESLEECVAELHEALQLYEQDGQTGNLGGQVREPWSLRRSVHSWAIELEDVLVASMSCAPVRVVVGVATARAVPTFRFSAMRAGVATPTAGGQPGDGARAANGLGRHGGHAAGAGARTHTQHAD